MLQKYIKYFSVFVFLMIILNASVIYGQEWVPIAPLKSTSSQGLYGELESRLPFSEFQRYSIPGNIKGTAHEVTHGVNAKTRNDYGLNGTGPQDRNKKNAFYVYGGYAAIIKEPPITIRQVASAVPQHQRKLMYQSYLIDPKVLASWNNQPLYIVDEMIAYLNGAVVAYEVGDSNPLYDYNCAVELHNIADVMYYECKKLPGNIYDCEPLRLFLNATRTYLVTLAPSFGSKNVSQMWRPSRPRGSNTCASGGCASGGCASGGGGISGGIGIGIGGGISIKRRIPMEYGPPKRPAAQPQQTISGKRKILPKFPRKPPQLVLPGPGPVDEDVSENPFDLPIPQDDDILVPIDWGEKDIDAINVRLDKLEKIVEKMSLDTDDHGDNRKITLEMFTTLVQTVEGLTKHEHNALSLSNEQLNALADKVLERLPPRRYQAKNQDGTLRGPVVEKKLGEILYLKSITVKINESEIDIEQ